MREFYVGGTLGDLYIIACKMYDLHRRESEQIKLIHYSIHESVFNSIDQLFELFPYVKLEHRLCRSVEEVDINLREHAKAGSVISVDADQNQYVTNEWSLDPVDITMEPYPRINIFSGITGYSEGSNIGIQLFAGSEGQNLRKFGERWVDEIVGFCQDNDVKCHLFGQGSPQLEEYYSSQKTRKNVVYRVNELAFSDWLENVSSLDKFISFEGFSAFFSMSQRVETLMFNQYSVPLTGPVHPAWRNGNVIVEINKNKWARKARHLLLRYKLRSSNVYYPTTSLVKDFIIA